MRVRVRMSVIDRCFVCTEFKKEFKTPKTRQEEEAAATTRRQEEEETTTTSRLEK